MISPFASPPPPYSPEHPHIILDHEKLAAAMSDQPPPLPPGEDCPATSPRPRGLRGRDDDIFHLEPTAALTLLARYVELIASMTGDVPPTPPASNPATPGTCTDKENQRNPETGFFFGNPVSHTNIDGVRIKSPLTPPPTENLSSSSDCAEGEILHGGVDDAVQYSTISRKFWCKSAPEVPIEAYLFRIHRFCPLSTAVYLAASFYLHHLCIKERIIPLTRLTAHRLVLAALRVAAKTLEDLSYPHNRFAKVGGLAELELSRMEVSFCFLMDFELRVNRDMMEQHVELLRNSVEAQVMLGKDGLVLSRTNSRNTPL